MIPNMGYHFTGREQRITAAPEDAPRNLGGEAPQERRLAGARLSADEHDPTVVPDPSQRCVERGKLRLPFEQLRGSRGDRHRGFILGCAG